MASAVLLTAMDATITTIINGALRCPRELCSLSITSRAGPARRRMTT
jgi:hypothetical protein